MTELYRLPEGQDAIVRDIHGGVGFAQRMSELGIRKGTRVRAIRGHGPMIVQVGRQKLVIGRGMVGRILVEPVKAEAAAPRGAASP